MFCKELRTNSYYFPTHHKNNQSLQPRCSVYCAVRTGYLNVMHGKAGPSPRWPQFDHKSVNVRMAVHQVAMKQVSLRVLPFSRQYHSNDAPFSSSTMCCGQMAETSVSSKKEQCPFGNGGAVESFYFYRTSHCFTELKDNNKFVSVKHNNMLLFYVCMTVHH